MQIKTTTSHLLTRLRTAILKRSSKLKCCRGRGEQRTLLHRGQGCKWVGAATKENIWRLLETRNRELPRFPAIPLLALIWKKNPNSKEYVHFYFQGSTTHNSQVRALTKISISWKMKTNWPIYTVEYTQKKKLPWAAAWMYWEIITLRYETKDKHPKRVLRGGSQKFMQMK